MTGRSLKCGIFNVKSGTTTVKFTVPYTFEQDDAWIVTQWRRGEQEPGPALLTTTSDLGRGAVVRDERRVRDRHLALEERLAAAAYCRISYWAASWFRSEQKCMRLRGLQLQ